MTLNFFYLPLSLYLIKYCKDRGTEDENGKLPINPGYFLICAIIDVHAFLLIVNAYNYTSITSVMLLEDFTIPCAVVLSVVFLKVKYSWIHYVGILLCISGTVTSMLNDLYVKKSTGDEATNILLGNIMTLGGSFLFATGNIL